MARKKENHSHFILGGTLIGNPELAAILGSMDRAIVLEQIYYYTQTQKDSPHNIHKDKEGNELVWCHNSYEEWQKHDFYWLSTMTVRRIFTWLEEHELLISDEFNKNREDRTKWYTISPTISQSFNKLANQKPEMVERIKNAEKKFNFDKDKWPHLNYTLQKLKKEQIANTNGVTYDEEHDWYIDPEQPGKHWDGTVEPDGAWVDNSTPKEEPKKEVVKEQQEDYSIQEGSLIIANQIPDDYYDSGKYFTSHGYQRDDGKYVLHVIN